MSILWLDFETYCETPIKHGVYAYAQNVEIMIAAFALDDGPVTVWDVTQNPDMPSELRAALVDERWLVFAHNSNFDRTVLNAVYPYLCPAIERWRDTMVMALAHSLPASLGALCEVLKVPTDLAKDKDGRRLILQFCKPLGKNRKLRRATKESHPADWDRFVSYAGSDILAMRECYNRMPKWNSTPAEVGLWHLDQHINDRGVAIDVALARAAVRATQQEQERLAYQTRIMTLGMVTSATQRDATLDYLRDCGVNLPDLQKATVRDYLAFGDLPTEARELLTVRMQSASTSTAKYDTLIKAVTTDDRLKGTLQFCGASRTGRWAGRTFQPQNLGRPTLKNAAIEVGIAAIKAGIEELVADNVMELLSSAVRGCLIAPKGRKLVIADLSNIEGRVLAWLAGETWKIDAFRMYDTLKRDTEGNLIPTGKHDDPWERMGHDLYKLAYAKSFGVDAGAVTKDQRQVGKVMELACLGQDTQVLTNRGYKRIVDVSVTDMLWDGVNWVSHKGVIWKGRKQTILLDGVRITNNHKILVRESWIAASELSMCESTHFLALATGSENLPLPVLKDKNEARVTTIWSESNAPVGPNRIQYLITILEKVKALGVTLVRKRKRGIGENSTMDMPIYAPTFNTADGCLIAYQPVTTDVQIQTTPDTKIMAVEAFVLPQNGVKIVKRFWHTLSRYRVGTIKLWNWIGLTLTEITNRIIYGLYREKRTSKIREKSEICKKKSMNSNKSCNVYDIFLAGSNNRFTIKTDSGHLIVHNCGYQGAVGAWVTFASAYGLDLEQMAETAKPAIGIGAWESSKGMYQWATEKGMETFGLSETAWIVCDVFKAAWRQAHPAVASYWKTVETAVQAAVLCPGDVICIGGDFDLVEQIAKAQVERKFAGMPGHYRRGHFRTLSNSSQQVWVSPCWVDETGKETKLGVRVMGKRQGPTIAITSQGSWLRIRLPSGRYLCYPSVKVDDKGKISYFGVNQFTKKWGKQDTYGGKIVENITQAVARDVLAYSMPMIEEAGYKICLTVHDEVISETPDSAEYNSDVLASIMSTTHEWAEGLPLAAAGFDTYRYRKE